MYGVVVWEILSLLHEREMAGAATGAAHARRHTASFFLVLAWCSTLAPAGAAPPCDKAAADRNRNEGRCPVAKCLSDDKYPSACARVARYRMQACPRAGSETSTSNDSECCCERMCHLEWANGTDCMPLTACHDFECCARNGNPIMESYPEQCHDPISGHTFTKCYPDGSACATSTSAAVGASNFNGKIIMRASFVVAGALLSLYLVGPL